MESRVLERLAVPSEVFPAFSRNRARNPAGPSENQAGFGKGRTKFLPNVLSKGLVLLYLSIYLSIYLHIHIYIYIYVYIYIDFSLGRPNPNWVETDR